MADITLDPDDDPDPELFSGGGGASAAAIGAWAWAALKNDNEDASWDTVSSAPAQVGCVSLLIYLFRPAPLRLWSLFFFFFFPPSLSLKSQDRSL